MDTVIDRTWTAESFLAWEDRQETRYEFDGRDIVPMTGGSAAHQRIVRQLATLLAGLLEGRPFDVLHEMRVRAGSRVCYPDVGVFPGPVEDDAKTLTDAAALFEVLSDDTGCADLAKLREYGDLPSLRSYVLLDQARMAATLFAREPGGTWTATPYADGAVPLAGLGIEVPLAAVYRGLRFAG
jgi:Uma2 family endonuclease